MALMITQIDLRIVSPPYYRGNQQRHFGIPSYQRQGYAVAEAAGYHLPGSHSAFGPDDRTRTQIIADVLNRTVSGQQVGKYPLFLSTNETHSNADFETGVCGVAIDLAHGHFQWQRRRLPSVLWLPSDLST